MKLNSLMLSTAVVCLMSGAAIAQDTTTTPDANGTVMSDDTVDTMATDTMTPATIEEMTVDQFLGLNVNSVTGDDVGEIDYLIGGMSGEPEAVIGVGGFLGLGEYTVALPLSSFTYNQEDNSLVVDMSEEELKAMPEFDETGVEGLEGDILLGTLMETSGDDMSTDSDTSMSGDAPAVSDMADPAPADTDMTEEAPADTDMTEEAPADTDMTEEAPADTETMEEAPADTGTTEEAPAESDMTDEETETESAN